MCFFYIGYGGKFPLAPLLWQYASILMQKLEQKVEHANQTFYLLLKEAKKLNARKASRQADDAVSRYSSHQIDRAYAVARLPPA